LPAGLKETYDSIWTKIQQQRFSRKILAEGAIELLLYSVQPLSAHAVAHAVYPDAFAYARNNEVVDVALILDACQGLVVLDTELGILRPIHFTAQAFLKDRFPESASHAHIAINCLRRISDPSTLDEVIKRTSKGTVTVTDFTIYAIPNWPVHALQGEKNSVVDSLETKFMGDEILHRLWIINFRALNPNSPRKISLLLDLLEAYTQYPDASLISACFFGLPTAELAINYGSVQPVEENRYLVRSEYFSWRPTNNFYINELALILSDWRVAGLVCASEQGHASIVKNLLKCFSKEDERRTINDTGPSRVYHVIRCCMHLAIANGHIDVVVAFREYREDALWRSERHENRENALWISEQHDSYPYANLEGGTLAVAAFRGQKKMIEFLVKTQGPKALPRALTATARWQNEKAFTLLLEYADNVDITPALRNAASANNGKVIELILEVAKPQIIYENHRPVVFVNEEDRQMRTALIVAAWEDCGEAAKALCQNKSVDLHRFDESGMNALQISVLECHTDFMASLLQRDDLYVNARGRWGETPLILAVRKGHTEAVRLLLNSAKVDTSLRDNGGLTAMDLAVMKDHEPIMKVLSQYNSPWRKLPLQEAKEGVTNSPSAAQQVGHWFQ
jgi:ankyrin repeat protein